MVWEVDSWRLMFSYPCFDTHHCHPFCCPIIGQWWNCKQLLISRAFFQNTSGQSVSRAAQNLLPRSRCFQWWPAPVKREGREKEWRWVIAVLNKGHFTKFHLCLMSSIKSALCISDFWTHIYPAGAYLGSQECVRAQIKYQGARSRNVFLQICS